MERDAIREELEQAIKDFNSHAHVERDMSSKIKIFAQIISTHTLTWSVTFGGYFGYSALVFISTHTLTWSVTVCLYFEL